MKSKKILSILFSLFLFVPLLAKDNGVKFSQHQLVVSFTNAATGYTQDDYSAFNIISTNKMRYGLIGEVNYTAKLLKWLSLGTGTAFILHRSFSSLYSLNPAPLNQTSFDVPLKYSEGVLCKGILDLPLQIIFSAAKKNKFEFQFAIGASFQYVVFTKKNSHNTDYLGNDYMGNQNQLFPGEPGIGLSIGPTFKIGNLHGVVIHPEFRLIQLVAFNGFSYYHLNAKAYSVGLTTGWFFNWEK